MKQLILTFALLFCVAIQAQNFLAEQEKIAQRKKQALDTMLQLNYQNFNKKIAEIEILVKNQQISEKKSEKLKRNAEKEKNKLDKLAKKEIFTKYQEKEKALFNNYSAKNTPIVKKEKSVSDTIFATNKTLDSVVSFEKKQLKNKILAIDKQLDNNEITAEQAQELKLRAAEETHRIIEQKTKEYFDEKIIIEKKDNQFLTTIKVVLEKPTPSPKRTQSNGLYFSIAYHNLNSREHFSNDAFRNWGSKSMEIGFSRNTRIFKNSNLLHLNYGIAFMMDKLKMRGDTYFVDNKGITTIEPFNYSTCVSKFKTHYLTLPINLELDFSPTIIKNGKIYYPTKTDFRVGVGAFVGVLTGNRQKIKYTDEKGRRSTSLDRSDFNLNQWIYGVTAHIGYRKTTFYMKYTLTPLFKNNPVKEYPFSVGIRFGRF